MRRITVTVEAPPPIRHLDGACADRSSPNAMPLFQAARALVEADPAAFPIVRSVGIVFSSFEPFPDVWPEHGYAVTTAIIEVLVDAGLLKDERLVDWHREEVRPAMTGYSMEVEEADVQG